MKINANKLNWAIASDKINDKHNMNNTIIINNEIK